MLLLRAGEAMRLAFLTVWSKDRADKQAPSSSSPAEREGPDQLKANFTTVVSFEMFWDVIDFLRFLREDGMVIPHFWIHRNTFQSFIYSR